MTTRAPQAKKSVYLDILKKMRAGGVCTGCDTQCGLSVSHALSKSTVDLLRENKEIP